MIWTLDFFGRVPFAIASGSGYALQVLTGYACCGLFAAIPHADTRAYMYTHTKKRSVFTSFSLVGGWVGKPPKNPIKNTSFALGMRRACVSMVRTAPKR